MIIKKLYYCVLCGVMHVSPHIHVDCTCVCCGQLKYVHVWSNKTSHIVLVVRPCDEYMASLVGSFGSVQFKR